MTNELTGYLRAGGVWGFRNHVLVLPLHAAACPAALEIAEEESGDRRGRGTTGPVAAASATATATLTIFRGFARHPNVFATVLVGLDGAAGEQTEAVDERAPATSARRSKKRRHGGSRRAAAAGRLSASSARPPCSGRTRPAPLSARSAWGSSAAAPTRSPGSPANPALGVSSDLLVAGGGTSILAEMSELVGAETCWPGGP